MKNLVSNNKLIVEVYKKEALKSSVTNGFATVEQKVAVKGLKLLMDARLNDGSVIPAGSMIYIKESSLHSSPWAQQNFQSDAVVGSFLIVDLANVEFVGSEEGV